MFVFGVLLVRIFPHLAFTSYLSVLSPNAGKYGQNLSSSLNLNSFRSFSGPYFLAFGLNRDTEYLSVFSPNVRETPNSVRKTPNTDTFHAAYIIYIIYIYISTSKKNDLYQHLLNLTFR